MTGTVQLKVTSRGGGDRVVRVMVANLRDRDFHPSSFPESEIQSVDGWDEGLSVLVLRTGAVIPVALTYEQLEQKIYSPNIRTDDGSVLDLRAVTGEAATPTVLANANKAPAPGDKMDDGTIYAGVSPNTGDPMYAFPADALLAYSFGDAQKHAKAANSPSPNGHDDWRVPTKGELNVLFNNRAAIGGFNVSGSSPTGWYWSSSSNNGWDAWGQRFSDGDQIKLDKDLHSSVRLVRSGT